MHLHKICKVISESTEFAIVDVETTGGSPKTTRITDIAIIISNGKDILAEYNTLVNPGCRIPWFISNLTNITDEMVHNAPPFHHIVVEVKEFLTGRCFIAHNVNFDYTVIRNEFCRAGLLLDMPSLCTVKIGRKLLELPSYNLDSLCDHFGITIHNRHRAYGDAYATTLIFHEYYKILQNQLIV